jgi:hypothetical protein
VELKNENQKWIIELDHIPVNNVGLGRQRWLSMYSSCPFSSSFPHSRHDFFDHANRELAVILTNEFQFTIFHAATSEI